MEQAQNEVKPVGVDLDEALVEEVGQITHKVGMIFDEEGEAVSGLVIVGKDSPQYQEVANSIRTNNMMRSSKRKDPIDTATEKGATTVVDIMVGNELKIAQAVTVGWFGILSGGVEAAFDKAKADTLLAKRPTWKNSVLADLEKTANFTKV